MSSSFRKRLSSCAAVLFFLLVSLSMVAQSVTAKSLAGLPGIPSNTAGDLTITPTAINFDTLDGAINIPKARIIAVSSGDERIETGGVKGKIVRAVLPYGSGFALATVTQKKVGLLTVEYLDEANQYHGAVFVLNTADIQSTMAGLTLPSQPLQSPQAYTPTACPAYELQQNAVRVEVITANPQAALPAEDRVLLYERLVQKLKSDKTILTVYRAGDRRPEAMCAEFTVTIRATAFNKGNQAVRASVGPLGHFVGATKLGFHLEVAKQDGTPIIEQDLKKSEGSDTDSLNITKVITKTVVKNVKKSRTQLRKAQLA